ncbi:[FeFe] hydrogenase H-cluster maturation GTPase HydF [Chitinivibrio alkaliphilus]|uniref:Era-like family GTPase n=1 Tax=Chitinivibrio alkaliphilus ACht1 TaxID=1313304 RepID=U7D535_9BACT|nr:[FeFe] hydrogenase H-cluster maturation GTPase HydF [Chitinivibrio alkaliphilus]ERP31053.1 Era-like family GTPase [Chitinivibrio alkaliphilus ACht1]
MEKTPKSLRLQIGLFGRTNTGKSSVLNMLSGQDVSITSPREGTTTDVVEKAMELLPVGPVLFLDTAGVADETQLHAEREKKRVAVFSRADVAVFICDGVLTESDETLLNELKERKLPLLCIINKCDLHTPSSEVREALSFYGDVLEISCRDTRAEQYRRRFVEALGRVVPEDFLASAALVGDLLPRAGHAVFIVPIDLQAPRGRLILPQVQAIRDILDSDCMVSVVKEREYPLLLAQLNKLPDLVVCDSQVLHKMIADTPASVPVTTFSILFARFKGELLPFIEGIAAFSDLREDDAVLVAEACSHHAGPDDIGRVKIPRWIRQFHGFECRFDVLSGRDYPDTLHEYRLVIHCGGCMLTSREMKNRMARAREAGVSLTNYGVLISFIQGGLKRVLSPFPLAQMVYEEKIEPLI